MMNTNINSVQTKEDFYKEIKYILREPIEFYEIEQNINDPEFTDLALKIFDEWSEKGIIK